MIDGFVYSFCKSTDKFSHCKKKAYICVIMGKIKEILDNYHGLKSSIHACLMHPVKCRPRLWLRMLRPLYTHCAWSSVIYRHTRMDVVPFHRFVLGKRSVVESFSCVNNAVGDVTIGDDSRIGLHNTLIGPVSIGSHVILAQGIVVSGLNHGFDNPDQTIDSQKVTTKPIVIEDDVWIGANSVVTAGVHIGSHVIVGAGSVVTHDIPPHSLAVGCPARVVRSI